MKIKCPSNFRQLTTILARLRGNFDLTSLCAEIDFSDVSINQIYYATLNRLPENREVCRRLDGDEARAIFKDFLLCDEFQDRIIENILHSYPEKRRLLYVHIPKTAGTDLTYDLSARYPTMRQTLMFPQDTSKEQLLRDLAEICSDLPLSDSIFVCGHNSLDWFLDKNLLRHIDRIFTVARDPVNLILSHVNYVLTVMFDEDKERPDRRRFWAQLGQDPPAADLPNAAKSNLAARILVNRGLIEPNYICQYLGRGNAETAIDSIARSGVEVVDYRSYEHWRRMTWGLKSSERMNRSMQYLSAGALDARQREYIGKITAEDSALYEILLRAWARIERPSVTGLDILEETRRHVEN